MKTPCLKLTCTASGSSACRDRDAARERGEEALDSFICQLHKEWRSRGASLPLAACVRGTERQCDLVPEEILDSVWRRALRRQQRRRGGPGAGIVIETVGELLTQSATQLSSQSTFHSFDASDNWSVVNVNIQTSIFVLRGRNSDGETQRHNNLWHVCDVLINPGGSPTCRYRGKH